MFNYALRDEKKNALEHLPEESGNNICVVRDVYYLGGGVEAASYILHYNISLT